MYRIAKTFQIHAAHQLDHLPAEHQCARLHGHTYAITIELAADRLADEGWIRDYGDLGTFREVLERLDHSFLNEAFSITTAEHIARCLYDEAHASYPEAVAVRVSESPTSWAEYRP